MVDLNTFNTEERLVSLRKGIASDLLMYNQWLSEPKSGPNITPSEIQIRLDQRKHDLKEVDEQLNDIKADFLADQAEAYLATIKSLQEIEMIRAGARARSKAKSRRHEQNKLAKAEENRKRARSHTSGKKS